MSRKNKNKNIEIETVDTGEATVPVEQGAAPEAPTQQAPVVVPLVSKPQAIHVLHMKVSARDGKGTVVAVVRGLNGKCELLGSTNLAKIGLISMKHYGRFVRPKVLGRLLGVAVIESAESARKILAVDAPELVSSIVGDLGDPEQE